MQVVPSNAPVLEHAPVEQVTLEKIRQVFVPLNELADKLPDTDPVYENIKGGAAYVRAYLDGVEQHIEYLYRRFEALKAEPAQTRAIAELRQEALKDSAERIAIFAGNMGALTIMIKVAPDSAEHGENIRKCVGSIRAEIKNLIDPPEMKKMATLS